MRSVMLVFGGLFRFFGRLIFTPILLGWMVGAILFGAMLGTLVATPFIFAFFDQTPGESAWQWLVFGPFMFVGAIFGFQYWRMAAGADAYFGLTGDSHGSARFANRKELKKLERGEGHGDADLLIGRNPHTGRLLRYDGPAHLITLAPTRAGKGVGTVIPNLLAAERSALVIDPKGENARIAGEARQRFGTTYVLDPFEVSGMPSAAYNPLDRLTPDSLDLGEGAASLTEALVMDPPGQVTEAHWNEEAKATLGGLIMFCVCHEDRDRRTLATVREYLTLPPDRLKALLELMQDSDAAGGLPIGFWARRIAKPPRFCPTHNATPIFWIARALPRCCRSRISTSRTCATGSRRCFWSCHPTAWTPTAAGCAFSSLRPCRTSLGTLRHLWALRGPLSASRPLSSFSSMILPPWAVWRP